MGSTSVVSMTAFLLVFAGVGLLGFVLFVRSWGDRRRALERLRDLGDGDRAGAASLKEAPPGTIAGLIWSTLPQLGQLLLPQGERGVALRKRQLLQAGYFGSNALRHFMGVTFICMLVFPILLVLIPYALGWIPVRWAFAACIMASAAGMIAPNIWLRSRVKKRQAELRNAFPDCLDMLVLCLEGGVTMIASIQRVASELSEVHPVLGMEMNIVQREVQLGLSPGEALNKMAVRCGLHDVRNLASVLMQSERYGASVVKAVRAHAEAWRQDRQNQAEETAQKASVKILFPTLLCIFPAIFIVLLGPAAFQLAQMFAK